MRWMMNWHLVPMDKIEKEVERILLLFFVKSCNFESCKITIVQFSEFFVFAVCTNNRAILPLEFHDRERYIIDVNKRRESNDNSFRLH